MRFQVQTSAAARTLPANDRFPSKRVDHATVVSEDGGTYQITMFVDPATPPAPPGTIIEGELGDPDNVDAGRRKFRATPPAAAVAGFGPPAGAGSAPTVPPAGAAPTPAPSMTLGLDPSRSRRIERQHSQEMALRYLDMQYRAGRIDAFNLTDVFALASCFELDLNPPSPAPYDVVLPTQEGQTNGEIEGQLAISQRQDGEW
jgi:hypothetical protein